MAFDDRLLGKYMTWLLMALVAACVLAAGATMLLIPPRLESHQDQIAYALNQRGVAYETIKLTQTSRDTQYYFAYAGYSIYGADVIVRLANARQVVGRIECRIRDSGCKLFLADVGLAHEPLPELDPKPQWVWLNWLRRILPASVSDLV
ncbi:MAG TPA: hypothetical protein VFO07_18950 [Roseiflexaceae bacterium]|nr:hypothetical protein [Roseiflexaceae bacterium]